MIDPAPQVYLIYGIPGSGRREILFDLIEAGTEGIEQTLYFRPEKEVSNPFDEQIEALENVQIVNWKLIDSKITHGSIKAAPKKLFFLACGTDDPADVAEAFKAWTEKNRCHIARIITVVHCAFLSKNDKAQPWFDACIHFSDMILLNRREDVNHKWVKDFELRYKKQFCPARFLLVKKGRLPNPYEVLEPETRRSSLYFDELIPIEEDEFEDSDLPEDKKPDKYIERLENGQRACRVPDIQKFL